ncbi:methyltransferase domain-containing protein [Asanoa sp. WMMD1127]|uniref:protein-L-isoaspartate O-methyltransferase family protein n=1 Tax=Asanoa sp. WMMD1127 TaxID=3016107 RepID=UPI002416C3FE|nr:methyltransferase domain-containing protein [Asanoa sp. WMMD1127]MDG4824297.1 methyltransferase domain-containing protein [Asanoa sp. WMMD1127]
MTDAPALRARLVDVLRADGGLTRADLIHAFATVPREVFLADGFHDREQGFLRPDDDGFLDAAYRNDALVTKLDDGRPVSSSSQPSLMALMIEELGVAAGMRVLEIGAGTGYNAALMAAVGADVTSVDVQPDVAARAAAALTAAGVGNARVRVGDGYLGAPEGAPYDRVIVTVGITGVSPHWLAQLRPGGLMVAPIAHAGNNPVLRVWTEPGDGRARPDWPARDDVWADGVCGAGFMAAAGPLGASYPWAHPAPVRADGPIVPTVRVPPRWRQPVDGLRYHDLWFAVGAWDRRATSAPFDGGTGCVLLDETRGGGAAIQADGAILAAGAHAESYAGDAGILLDRWVDLGTPGIERWRAAMVLSGEPEAPIYVPREWALVV